MTNSDTDSAAMGPSRLSLLKNFLGPLGWGTLLVFIVTRFSDLVSFLWRVVLGHYLPREDFGAVDPVSSLVSFLTIPVAIVFLIGVKSVSRLEAVGRMDSCRSLVRDLVRGSLVGSAATVLLLVVFRNFILVRLHLESPVYLGVIALTLIGVWWLMLLVAVLQSRRDYRRFAWASLLNSVLALGFTFLLVPVLNRGLPGGLAAKAIASILTVAVFWFVLIPRDFRTAAYAPYDDEKAAMGKMLWPMSVYFLSITLLVHFDRLLVRNFIVTESGGYGAVVTLGSIASAVVAAVVFVLFPLASAEHAGGRSLRKIYLQALLIGLLITLAGAGGFFLLAGPILKAWNASFVDYSGYVWIHALAMGLNGMVQIVASVELARHRYGFLWFVAIPALAMCVLMHAWSSGATLTLVLNLLVGAHVVILAGLFLYVLAGARRATGNGNWGGGEGSGFGVQARGLLEKPSSETESRQPSRAGQDE